jgi:hypothetical protein
MKEANIELYEKLRRRTPAFLFLGQKYLSLEDGQDSLLSQILRKYDHLDQPRDYSQIFDTQAKITPEASLAWMHERCNRLNIPAWLEIVASFPWSGIYTTAIDSLVGRAFQAPWREVQSLYDESLNPSNPRNPTLLNFTFLYGCVNQIEVNKQPPLEEDNLDVRQGVATILSLRLPELVTPLGVLVIEGYAGSRDWFEPKQFATILSSLNIGQVHLFSASDELCQDEKLSRFIDSKKIIAHQESLATYLVHAAEQGLISLEEPVEREEHGKKIQLQSRSLPISLRLWNQVSRTATILDDSVIADAPYISENRIYTEFRRFLAESSTKPIWSGYSRNFYFHRDFYTALYTITVRKLASNELQDKPILLSGSAGTGKSIALGWLAYKICQDRHYPVLFIPNRSKSPLFQDLEAFCRWAENSGAPATLIVWDGVVDESQYYDLAKWLAGKARKAILVGSMYYNGARDEYNSISNGKESNIVSAPPSLNKLSQGESRSEQERFLEYLERLVPTSEAILKSSSVLSDGYFLVALYRLLPYTRGQIQDSLTREVRFVEQYEENLFENSGVSTVVPSLINNPMAIALQKAGLSVEENSSDLEVEEFAGESVTPVRKLLRYVMVAGQFGLNIPLEVLMRVLSNGNVSDFLGIFKQVATDLVCWYADDVGDIEIGPRHRLEAEQLVQSLIGRTEDQFVYAKELLLGIRERNMGRNGPEISFALKLIRGLGPNGPRGTYFESCYEDLAQVLAELRTKQGIQHTSLMLQEATLLRESVVEKRRKSEKPEDSILECLSPEAIMQYKSSLSQAEDVLKSALESLELSKTNKGRRSRLLIELSAVLGTKFILLADISNYSKETVQCLEEAQDTAFDAFALNSENYYPIDILAWTSIKVLKDPDLNLGILKAKVEKNILHAFALASLEDFPSEQQSIFASKRSIIGNCIGDLTMSEQALNDLLQKDPAAAYYLKAYEQVKDLLFQNKELDPAQIEKCLIAVELLEKNYKFINQDSKALYLLLRSWWLSKTKRRLFYEERQILAFDRADWQKLSDLLKNLMATSEFYESPSLLYLQGIAEFHLNKMEKSRDTFKHLEQVDSETGGRRRIIRSYLASDEQGRLKRYRGTVSWRRPDPREAGEIFVEELRREVRFIPQQFNQSDIQPGEVVGEFHIAFNFLGPIADPVEYYRQYTERRNKPVLKK